MRKLMTGYVLLYVILIGLTLWASPASAGEPAVAVTCHSWGATWRDEPAVLRALVKRSFAKTQKRKGLEMWGLCLLMNVDYFINTTLAGCDAGLPLDVAGPLALQGLGERCAAGLPE